MAARQAPLSLEFCCTAKWFSYKYTHILHFKNSFPLWFIPGDWIEFPVLYSRTLLFIHPRYNSLHLLIPNSQSILPLLLSHLVNTRCKEAALIEGAGGCWELFIMLAHFCTHTPPHHTQVQPHTYTDPTDIHRMHGKHTHPHIHTYISHPTHIQHIDTHTQYTKPYTNIPHPKVYTQRSHTVP